MRPSTRELSALIGAVYEAGLDPSGAGWPAALEGVSALVAGDGPVVLAVQHRPTEYAHTHYVRTDAADAARYPAYYARIDPVLEPRLPHAAPGALLLSDALMPARELHRTEFYADWLRPLGLGAGAAAVLLRRGSAQVHLFAVRPRRQGAFAGADLQALTLLLPHLAAAVATTLRLLDAGAGPMRDALAGVLDRSADGVLLVDRDGRLCSANRTAAALLAAGDRLAVAPARGGGRGVLRAATPVAAAGLARLVRAAAAVADAGAAATALAAPMGPAGGALALPRASGREPLAAFVIPIAPGDGAPASWLGALLPDAPRAVAVVLVTDPAAAPPRPAAAARDRLRAAFGLTPAEAVVAVAAARGLGLRAVAAAHGVTLATVRTQAQAAYRKTGTRGQAGLARVVERLARWE